MKRLSRSIVRLACALVLLNTALVPRVSAKPASNIDPCLVGDWMLKRMGSSIPALGASGLAGTKMAILRNGYTTVVLTGSAPYVTSTPVSSSQRLVGTETFYIDATREKPQGGDELLPDRFHADYGESNILSPIHTSIIDTHTVDLGGGPVTRTYRLKQHFFDTFSYTCTASTLTMDLGYNSPTSTWASDNIAIWKR